MRLVNTASYDLQEFVDAESTPKYAVLSHRWQNDEVLYKQYRKGRYSRDAQGFRKIKQCCDFAHSRGQQWVWIDTCCIDKSSSAELSEAINSMFRWYNKADECYAYLSDVTASSEEPETSMQQFRSSKWFTRGWTLQELIAPRRVIFVSSTWSIIGYKQVPEANEQQVHLTEIIRDITGIPLEVLAVPESRFFFSVAQRMSWAARRKTTRTEDAAYCLLGLFGLNMSLLYGEGKDAFLRLQRELFSRTGDETLFAWPLKSTRLLPGSTVSYDLNSARGVLAEDVECFVDMNHVRALSTKDPYLVLTGYGAEITVKAGHHPRAFYSGQDSRFVCLPLLTVDNSEHPEQNGSSKHEPYCVYLHTTGCGHYGRFALPDYVRHDDMDWQPFPDDRVLIVHHTRSEAFRYCSSISFKGQYFEGRHFGHIQGSGR